MKKAVLIYDEDALRGDAASRDVLDQMEALEGALGELGFVCERIGADLDLGAFKRRLLSAAPDIVCNLVESLDGSDRLQTVVTMLLEDWGLVFTGCGSAAMMVSNHKIETKRRLFSAGIPTAGCVWRERSGEVVSLSSGENVEEAGDWIIKAVEAHASLFMDDASVVRGVGLKGITERLQGVSEGKRETFFAERFIEGREFNVSVLEGEGGAPEVLPVAEICFDGLPEGKPRIVGYAAKWDEESEEYSGTPRKFVDKGVEGVLVDELVRLAKATWTALGLGGYARVDFRVDAGGEVYVLEANSNPCLSLDAGFAAAAERAGLGFTGVVRRIVRAAERTRGAAIDKERL